MTWKKTLAGKAFNREFNIALNLTMGVLFGVWAILTEHHWPAVIMAWSSGAQLGYAFMWIIAPRVSERFKLEMQKEIAIIHAQVLRRITEEALDSSLYSIVPDQQPPERMN